MGLIHDFLSQPDWLINSIAGVSLIFGLILLFFGSRWRKFTFTVLSFLTGLSLGLIGAVAEDDDSHKNNADSSSSASMSRENWLIFAIFFGLALVYLTLQAWTVFKLVLLVALVGELCLVCTTFIHSWSTHPRIFLVCIFVVVVTAGYLLERYYDSVVIYATALTGMILVYVSLSWFVRESPAVLPWWQDSGRSRQEEVRIWFPLTCSLVMMFLGLGSQLQVLPCCTPTKPVIVHTLDEPLLSI